MAKQKEHSTENLRELSEYYKINTKSVDDLVNATSENSPPVPPEELKKYRSASGGIHLTMWMKAVLIKFWFAGAACFFIFWGLGTYISSTLDMLFVFGVSLGMVMDLLENSIFRFIAPQEGDNDVWMMFPRKGVLAFLLNILYGVFLLLCVDGLYQVINTVLVSLTGNSDTIPLGVEPICFGLFYMGVDLLLLGVKALCKRIFSDARRAAEAERK